MATAQELVGERSVHYMYGRPDLGRTPEDGFDCSGLVSYVLDQAGLYVPDFIGMDGRRRPIRHCNDYLDHYGVLVHAEHRQPGDIAVFSPSEQGKRGFFASHIGILTTRDTYVHGGTKWFLVEERSLGEAVSDIPPCDPLETSYGGLRQVYSNTLVAIKRPTVPIDFPTYRYHQRPVE